MKNTIYTLIFLFGGLLSAQSVKFISIEELDAYQDLLSIARQKDQLLFVSLYQDGDVFQDMYRSNIFDASAVKPFWNKAIPVAIDIRSEMGAAFANQFLVDSLPLFLALNKDEFVVNRKASGMDASTLAAFTQTALSQKNLFDTLASKYANHTLTSKEWQKLLQLHSYNFPFEETMSVALEYLATLDENQLSESGNLKVLTTYGIDLTTPYPKKVFKNLAAIKAKNKGFSASGYYETVYSYNLDLAIASKDTVLLQSILNELIPKHPDSTVKENELQLSSARLFGEETELYGPYVRIILAEAEKLNDDSAKAEYLFDEAYYVADNYNEKEPLKGGLKIIEKAIEINELYKYVMLKSYIHYLLKDKTQALTVVAKAKALSTEGSVELKRAESLEKLINRLPEKIE